MNRIDSEGREKQGSCRRELGNLQGLLIPTVCLDGWKEQVFTEPRRSSPPTPAALVTSSMPLRYTVLLLEPIPDIVIRADQATKASGGMPELQDTEQWAKQALASSRGARFTGQF
jgi:hypothetical protein